MKFLCPSCKAKYQIADEKVAGRSVRMKCRKCGHMISIAKAVTEGSVSRKLDGGAAPSASPPPPSSKPGTWREPGEAAVPKRAPPPRPGARAASSPFAAAPPPRPAPPPRKQAASPSPPAASPTRSAPGAGAAQMSEVSSSTPSPAPRNGAGNGNGSAAVAFGSFAKEAGLTSYPSDDDEQTVIAGVGVLAGAFSQAVHAPESSSLVSTPADEWYVGINGVPVGPIRLSELRSKASAGAITLDSLVWREGFEEWQPLRTFPELIAIVEEGMSSARASLTPLSPAVQHSPTPAASPFAPSASPAPVAGILSDPFAAPPSTSAVAPPSVEKADVSELTVLPPRRTGAAAWIAVVVALMFGLTIGFVLFSRDKGEPVVKIVEVPAKAAPDTPAPASAAAPAASAAETETVEVAGQAGGGKVAARAGGTTAKQPDDKGEKGGLSGLKGLSAVSGGGPSGGPAGGTSGGAAGGQLDSSQVQRVVSRYTGSVKRSCWQPALDTRAKDAPTSARVAVTITVAPSGSVQNVTTSGDPKGYRGLASCIAGRVRGWQFPASSGTTTVNVPFFFAAQ